jgi:hypothetical protein
MPQQFITEAICNAAVKKDGEAIGFVPLNFISGDLCYQAIKQDAGAI